MFKYKFVEYRKIAYIISLTILLIGAISFLTLGLNVGIDFTGGTRLHFKIGQEFTVDEVRELLTPFDLQGSQVQKAGDLLGGEDREVILITPSLSGEKRNEVIAAFQTHWPHIASTDMSIENVGPTIGEELRQRAFWALLIAILGVIIYITIRFEFKFAIAAIAALVHDALIVLTFFSLLQIEINSPFIAAILTIIGYSINDTIVIFDRIRENLKGRRKADFAELINRSITQTLIRSINTSATTLVVLLSLFFLGGVTIQPFIIALLIGVVTGTYSSIFIASQVWLSWKEFRERRNAIRTT